VRKLKLREKSMESYMMILCVLLLLFIHTPMDQTPLLCLVCDLCFACWTTRTPTAYYTFESITYEKETENIIYMPSIQLKRRQIKKARSMPTSITLDLQEEMHIL
jgi:hypothetical protein